MKRIVVILSVLMMFILSGCGNTDELDAYYNGLTIFNGNVQIITETLELIDSENDDSINQVSAQLDKLVEQFKTLSELKVPKKFDSCGDLAKEGYNYIVEADKLYKEWAEKPDTADAQLVSMAKENYDRAMVRVNYIAIILQGGVPQGDGVSVTEEDVNDFKPVDDNSSNYVVPEIEIIE